MFAAVREICSDPKEKASLVLLLVAAVVWALELYAIQSIVYVAPFKMPWGMPLRCSFRFIMDLAFVGFMVLALSKHLTSAILIGQVAVFVFGGVYFDTHGRPPSISVILGNFGEGVEFAWAGFRLVRMDRVLIFGGLLILKLALLWSARPLPRLGLRRLAAASGVVWTSAAVIALTTFEPLHNMSWWGTTLRYGITYGFTLPTLAEAYYARSSGFLERALVARESPSDLLTGVEQELPARPHVVFLQLESWDWRLLGHRVDGREVTPNLNRLAERSMVFRTYTHHRNGSADADFTLLAGVAPSPDVVTYRIDGYPFGDSLPSVLAERGFESEALHGVSGEFYSRRVAYEQMGFGRLFFREELERDGVAVRNEDVRWIQDGEVLQHAAERMASADKPTFHMIISVTSHAPFDSLPRGESTAPEGSDLATRYFDSMAYVDRCVGKYLELLPKETTVVIYGDHNSAVDLPNYKSGRVGDRDFVPTLIYDTEVDLASTQKTRGTPLATDGRLSLIDVARYMRGQIRLGGAPASASIVAAPREP